MNKEEFINSKMKLAKEDIIYDYYKCEEKLIDKIGIEHDNYELKQENKKLKDVINKINNYINNYDIFKVFSFPLMKRWEEDQVKLSIDYEFKTSLIKDLKDILKEVSD